MKNYLTLSIISRIREKSNSFIISELESQGIKGIVPSHGDILVSLYYSREEMTLKDIAVKIKRTQPTVTVLVDKLINLGYVTKKKNPHDARSTYIVLTEKGESFKEVFIDLSQKLNTKMHNFFTESEADQLESLLKKMSENL